MKLTSYDIARMIELSAVQARDDEDRIRSLAEKARRYRCIIATTLPGFTPNLKELLEDVPDVGVGGNVGFPSGGVSRSIKVAEAKELIRMGCGELDMVIHIGMLRSGRHQYVEDEIKSVVDAAGKVPVKVILECHYLSDDEIRRGCELCVKAGAAFIKTGTGWAPTGASLENIALIKSCVGDAISIKASGGIRDLETVVEMYRRGARRFGIGLGWEAKIFEQCAAQGGVTLQA